MQWCDKADNKKNLLEGLSKEDAAKVLWTMHGQERCANRVLAEDIIGAVEITRTFKNEDDYSKGGTFQIDGLDYEENPNYVGCKDLAKAVAEGMEKIDDETMTMPSREEGFVKSTPNEKTHSHRGKTRKECPNLLIRSKPKLTARSPLEITSLSSRPRPFRPLRRPSSFPHRARTSTRSR